MTARISRPSAGADAPASRWAEPPRRGPASRDRGARGGLHAGPPVATAANPEGRP